MEHGGISIADVLHGEGVRALFTLCGGHISPILVGAKQRGIRVLDLRDERNAVFAADATARLTGVPGVAAVTAGPGLTNALTALKNAELAQSPVVLLGGAAATMLKGRGSLQDIDQLAVVRPHVKWAASVRYAKDLGPVVTRAFEVARGGVPGPVYVECPVDLLYPEKVVRSWYEKGSGGGSSGLKRAAVDWVVTRHLDRLFDAEGGAQPVTPRVVPQAPLGPLVGQARRMLDRAQKPVLLVGSQAVSSPREAADVARAIDALGVPSYLASMARGLLGPSHPLLMRHKRRAALKEADLVILAGVPCDFRLEYGRAIGSKAKTISVNLSVKDLFKNRVPSLPVPASPARFITALAEGQGPADCAPWRAALRERDEAREEDIAKMASEDVRPVNPLALLKIVDEVMADDATIVADGGDFVASAAYILRARGPLRWLDPGAFGTLGVGAGFAFAAAALGAPEVWLIYGDGAAGFSLMEIDSFVRHGLGVIALVGNDRGWTQIAREQVPVLDDDVGTVLGDARYDGVATALGGVGLRIEHIDVAERVLREAQACARDGRPVVVNAPIGVTEFRKGSISL